MTTSTMKSQLRANPRRVGTAIVGLSGLFAVLTAGCDVFMQKPLCPELPACGGDPVGNWILAPMSTSASCAEDLYVPPTDTRLVAGEIPPARAGIPEPALFDWCLLLVTNGGMEIQAKPPRFSVESAVVGAASVRLGADGQYSVGTTRTGTYELDFPTFCMRAFGAKDGRVADPVNNPNGPPVNICKQIEIPVGESGLGEGAYRNTTCDINPADPGGCICKFDVSAAGGSAGQYSRLSNDTLLHLPNTNFPQQVKFCQQGDRLQLTGADHAYLFDQPGLRTLDLVRAPPVMQ